MKLIVIVLFGMFTLNLTGQISHKQWDELVKKHVTKSPRFVACPLVLCKPVVVQLSDQTFEPGILLVDLDKPRGVGNDERVAFGRPTAHFVRGRVHATS